MKWFSRYEENLIRFRHGIEVLDALGIRRFRATIFAHNETPSDKVVASVESDRLIEAGRRKGVLEYIIERPLSLDRALISESCERKAFESVVLGEAGHAAMLGYPQRQFLYRAMTVIGNTPGAAFNAGSSVPIIFSTRGDVPRTQLGSITFAAATCRT